MTDKPRWWMVIVYIGVGAVMYWLIAMAVR
jgi:hypothetical protein